MFASGRLRNPSWLHHDASAVTELRRIAAHWRSVRRERRALSRLDGHLLDDIGLTRDEAARETRRPPWDAPAHWYR